MNEGGLYEWGFSLRGNSMRGTWGEAALLGMLKDMLSKTLEMGVCFHRGPTFGEHGEILLSLFRENFVRNLREM